MSTAYDGCSIYCQRKKVASFETLNLSSFPIPWLSISGSHNRMMKRIKLKRILRKTLRKTLKKTLLKKLRPMVSRFTRLHRLNPRSSSLWGSKLIRECSSSVVSWEITNHGGVQVLLLCY
ncbi:hypothetical protein D8674_021660 [Pyrus ussuriensis x Pyrus communis]|uniref:Uncharacterized protein n=1 Tax=Pyrus ussuriensis x Pyrus communis TaxID=2448454 RepID=A0A5N5GN60_9ROSA|nr:hypothetical protein D8674_021660 [Pyrus ussuriensis x Pyrus communis]